MKKLKLTDIAPYSGKRVQPFDGVKKYLSTGDLQDEDLSFEEVTFKSKPSRADILVSEGDILFAKMANTNKVLQIDTTLDGIIVSTGFSVHKPDENVLHGNYLIQFLKNNLFLRQKNKLCTGAIQSAISNTGIEKILVPAPSLSDQIQIANMLCKVETLIQQRKKSIALLDEFLKSTFLEMFGDPAFNKKEWKKLKFKDTIYKGDKINYGVVQPGDDSKDGVPIIRVGDFEGTKINSNNLKIIDTAVEQKHKASRLFGDELLLACVGATIGKIALVSNSHKGYNIVRAIARVRCDSEKLNKLYLCHLLLTSYYQFALKNLARTIAQPTLNIKQIEELNILIPPIELQTQFANIVIQTETLKEQYKASLIELENLYGNLSQRAFKGELELSFINAQISKEEKSKLSSTDLHAGILTKIIYIHSLNPIHKSTLGHVKAEKICHIIESHLSVDLGRDPKRIAAGPADYTHLKKVEHRAKMKNWFTVSKREDSSGYKYKLGRSYKYLLENISIDLGSRESDVNNIINLFLKLDSHRAEVVVTTYTAWNDLLLERKNPSDEEIVKEARLNWTESKLKIAEDKFLKSIEWIRKKNLIPIGKGKHTIR